MAARLVINRLSVVPFNATSGFGSLMIIMLLALIPLLSFPQSFSFIHDGYTRDYILHVPPSYKEEPTPLVINMHGITSNAWQQQLYSGMDVVANKEGFIVVYPNGVNATWNVGLAGPYTGGVDDVSFIDALVDTISATYNIDQTRVYSTGMSNGGFMSYRLACELGHRVAAIASVTGSMTDSMKYFCTDAMSMPVMEIHGTTDAIVPYLGSLTNIHIDSVIKFWVRRNPCPQHPQIENLPNTSFLDLSTVTRYTYSPCGNGTKIVLLRVNNGGHTWPGSAFPVPIGNTNYDIDASTEIWNFFKQFQKKAVIPAPSDSGPVQAVSPKKKGLKVYNLPAHAPVKVLKH